MIYHLLLWFTTFLWGVSFVATKVVVEVFPPFIAALLRFSLAWLVLLIFSRGKAYGKKKDLILTGLWGVSLYFVFENLGMVFTLPTNAVLIISLIPILNTIYLRLFHKKRLTWYQIIGSIVSFTGVCIVVLNGNLNLKLNPAGDILVFLAAIAWVCYTHYILRVEKEKKPEHDDTFAVTRSITGWGVVFLIPFSVYDMISRWDSVFTVKVTWQSIAGIVYLGVLCSSLGYYFWNKAIQRLGPRYTTNTIYVMPVITYLSESLLLGNNPNDYTILGGVCVLAGLFISEWRKKSSKGNPSRHDYIQTAKNA
jgi:drug/metabolite transporter (DMT)-like permease